MAGFCHQRGEAFLVGHLVRGRWERHTFCNEFFGAGAVFPRFLLGISPGRCWSLHCVLAMQDAASASCLQSACGPHSLV